MIRFLPTRIVKTTNTEEIKGMLLPELRDFYGANLVAVFLFGSYASGKATDSSDLDLLIVIRSSAESPSQRLKNAPCPADYCGPPLSPVVLTLQEYREFPPIVLALLDSHLRWYPTQGIGGGETSENLVREVESYVQSQEISRVRFRGGHYWRRAGSR
jgi:hypothetical protein